MNRYFFVAAACAAALCLGTAGSSPASFVQATSRAALAGTDHLDWATKGVAFTPLPNPFTITSTGGVTATVSEAGAAFTRMDEGSGWAGYFAPGDALLYTSGTNGPITVMFTTALSAAGAQMQSNFFPSFTGKVEALAADGTSLASFTFSGPGGSGPADNTAVFAGISTTGGSQFFGLRFTMTGGSNINDFAINRFDFTPVVITPTAASAPAPAGLLLGLLGVAPAAALIRRRRTAVAA